MRTAYTFPITHEHAWEGILREQDPHVALWPKPGDCDWLCKGFGSIGDDRGTSHPCGRCAGTGYKSGRLTPHDEVTT